MPIETWKTEKAQNDAKVPTRQQQISHGEGRVLQHTFKGEPQTKMAPINQQGENHAAAGRYNGNAPYKDPNAVDRTGRCKGKEDTCNGWATSTGLCPPHQRVQDGLTPYGQEKA